MVAINGGRASLFALHLHGENIRNYCAGAQSLAPLDFFAKQVPLGSIQVMQMPIVNQGPSRGNFSSNDIKEPPKKRNSAKSAADVREIFEHLGPLSQKKLHELTRGQIGEKALRKHLKTLEKKGQIERYRIRRPGAKSAVGYKLPDKMSGSKKGKRRAVKAPSGSNKKLLAWSARGSKKKNPPSARHYQETGCVTGGKKPIL